ncbi:MAG TPA: protein kinase [Chloroflexia bacterium]|nr:protein kinase [Chloroflexia bacterium]
MADWVGRTLSRVEIERLLGRGGMAEVYLGRHVTLDRPVAVKVLFSHLSDDPELLSRFQREARAIATLRHPHIVEVFDFDIVDGQPYMVMEWLPGISLAEYLAAPDQRGRPVAPETVLRLIAPLAAALDYAHARGVVHRDVKPSNVMLTSEGAPINRGAPLPPDVRPVLTDFGIIRLTAGAAQHTATGSVMGTPAYMSPEQARGEVVDGRADIYSLGVMLYELLAGRLPFDPGEGTPFALMMQHVTQPPPPLAGATPLLQAVLDHALAKDPANRYETAGALAADLDAALSGSSYSLDTPSLANMPSRVAGPLTALPAMLLTGSTSAPTGRAALPTAGLPAPRGNSRLLVAAGVGILLIAGGLLFGRDLLGGMPGSGTPSPTSVSGLSGPTGALPTPGPSLGTLRFGDVAGNQDQVTLAVAGLPPAADGGKYEGWLLGEGGEQRISLGVLKPDAQGGGALRYVDRAGQNLLRQFDSYELTVEPAGDTNPLPSGRVAFAATLPPQALVHVRHLLVAFPAAPGTTSLTGGLLTDAKLVNQFAQELLAAQQAGDLARMKHDAEVLVNLIEGRLGAHTGDGDGDGQTESEGDGWGLLLNGENLGYIQGTFEHARNAERTPDATPHIKLHAGHVEIVAQNISGWAVEIRDRTLHVAAAPTTAAAADDVLQVASLAGVLLNGHDLNGDERIDPIPGEGGAITAYQHAQYMADLQITASASTP